MEKTVGIMLSLVQKSMQNRDNNIKRAINSIKNQTYKNWICSISIEQGKEINDMDIFDAIGDDGRFIFIPGTVAKGYGSCRNIAANMIGDVDYLCALDSSDEFKPEHISRRVELFKKNPDIDYAYGEMDIKGEPYVLDMYDKTRKIKIVGETSQGPTIFIKKPLFDRSGGYKDMYGADGELLARIINSKKFKVVELKDAYYQTYILHHN